MNKPDRHAILKALLVSFPADIGCRPLDIQQHFAERHGLELEHRVILRDLADIGATRIDRGRYTYRYSDAEIEQARNVVQQAGMDAFLVVIRSADIYFPLGIFSDREIAFGHARRIAVTMGATYEAPTGHALAIFKQASKRNDPDVYVQRLALNDASDIEQALKPRSRYSEVMK